MQGWNVLRPARWKYHSKNRQKVAIWAPSYRQSEKMVKQQCLPHMPLQYADHRPTSSWDLLASLGHPCKFQQVSRLGSVTALHCSSRRQPNFAALNRGRHLYSAGRPPCWALAHISSSILITVYDDVRMHALLPVTWESCNYGDATKSTVIK